MYKTLLLLVWAALVWPLPVSAQDTGYYLPADVAYDPAVPTPRAVLGYEVGEWFVSHDQLLRYMERVAQASPRIVLDTIGYTCERRPLVHLLITHPDNHARLEDLRQAHLRRCDPAQPDEPAGDPPAVVWMGYSIHGDEASGSNAALLVAYYLAAARGAQIDDWLRHLVIILDPSFNPDGLQRFATWANSHRGIGVLRSEPADREHEEVWPTGRTNHFWFDLNRDWLPAQLPESQARLRVYHRWKPNLLTDHHEMGTASTFFFQPGVPSRNHPLTPPQVFDLTGRLAQRHAQALDSIGSLYFTEENFDDFYFGKSSTYPDINGGVGILFEQASSEGQVQARQTGDLTFAFTIRNQFVTSLSSLRGAFELRRDFLAHQRAFYRTALDAARQDPVKAFVVASEDDEARITAFAQILQAHDIQLRQTDRVLEVAGQTFPVGSLLVPCDQPQYRLIRALFETRTTFTDSLFYDISAWTLPLAFNLPYAALDSRAYGLLATQPYVVPGMGGQFHRASRPYAYVFRWNDYYAPRALNALLAAGVQARVASEPFDGGGQHFDRGSILIPVQEQALAPVALDSLLQVCVERDGLDLHTLETGRTTGVNLGSNLFRPLEQPRVLLVVGEGVSSYEAGEVWHLLDTRYGLDMAMVEASALHQVDWSQYNTLVMVQGSYGGLSLAGDKLREWLAGGGVLIAYKGALRWLKSGQIGSPELLPADEGAADERLPYAEQDRVAGARVIGGAIFQAHLDLTHPLGYGFARPELSLFRNSTLFMGVSESPFGSPVVYTPTPLRSGYVSEANLRKVAGSAAVNVFRVGRGCVVAMTDNPNFRGYWYGSNRLFANALFFGRTIE